MDELRDHFLTRAAFTGDEHRCVGHRHFAGEVNGLLEGGRRAENRQFVAVAVLRLEVAALLLAFPRQPVPGAPRRPISTCRCMAENGFGR